MNYTFKKVCVFEPLCVCVCALCVIHRQDRSPFQMNMHAYCHGNQGITSPGEEAKGLLDQQDGDTQTGDASVLNPSVLHSKCVSVCFPFPNGEQEKKKGSSPLNGFR